ncbi:diguanylate cyclase [Novosphingobium sp. RD2P27]|uniref:diguanylate cyclase n=1 Tax=Novosphingobium kalidii TaxID=3230299 RepID=A0ABV2CZ03_9SPHN
MGPTMFSSAEPSASPSQPAVVSATFLRGARLGSAARTFLLVAAIVWVASLLGLTSRHAASVSVWPANAVLVGVMLRARHLMRPAGWIGAAAGFIVADLLFGRTPSLAAFFASANLAGTLAATLLLMRLDERDLQLRRTHSVLRILACLLPACLAAGGAGAVLVVVEFEGSALQALMTWPASELVNYLTFLPAMLTLPRDWFIRTAASRLRDTRNTNERHTNSRDTIVPAVLLAVSCVAAVLFDGPGSIMFPMPALLLCALTYTTATTAMLTMVLGTGCLTVLGLELVDIGQDMSVPAMTVSVRVAVAFLVLVPLTISSAMAVRDDLLNRLRQAADHDGLTGLLNRRAFERQMALRLKGMQPPSSGYGFAVLLLDIDHFKAINDCHGHPAGDEVLRDFAAAARSCCRSEDLIGRVGGEEFGLLLRVSNESDAQAAADRIRQVFAEQTTTWQGEPIRATVSIGAQFIDRAPGDVLELVSKLDQALYRAKRSGRDRVEWVAAAA